MDAITFLVKEHKKVRKNLSTLNKKNRRFSTKKALFDALCKDLIRHETMEQKVWYPHFKNNKKLKAEVKHLVSEEHSAAKEITKFKKSVKTEDEWEKKFPKFKKAR